MKSKKYLWATIVSVFTGLAIIIVMALLIGDVEYADFDKKQLAIFWSGMGLILLSVVLDIVFAAKSRHEKDVEEGKFIPPKLELKDYMWLIRLISFFILSGIISTAITLLFIKLGEKIVNHEIFLLISIVAFMVIMVLALLSYMKKNKFFDEMESIKDVAVKEFIEKQRAGEDIYKENSADLKRVTKVAHLIEVLLALLTFTMLAAGGLSGEVVSETNAIYPIVSGLVGMFFIFILLFRIPCQHADNPFKNDELSHADKIILKEKDYPEIYKAANGAAEALEITDKVEVAFSGDGSIGVADDHGKTVISIDEYRLNVLSPDELYTLFLQQLAYYDFNKKHTFWSAKYAKYIDRNYYFHAVFFSFIDYYLSYSLFMYENARNLVSESNADKVALKYSTTDLVRSTLLKTFYINMCNEEDRWIEGNAFYEKEKFPDDSSSSKMKNVSDIIKDNFKRWNHLLDVEILSDEATKRTIKMRLNDLGINDYVPLFVKDSPAIITERNKINKEADHFYKEMWKGDYEFLRNIYYVPYKQVVDEWEAKGEPFDSETCVAVLLSLKSICQFERADEFACHMIETLSPEQAESAISYHGLYLLSKYDDSGIDYLYKALSVKHRSFFEDTFISMYLYCLRTGNKTELDEVKARMENYNVEEEMYGNLEFSRRDKYIEFDNNLVDDIKAYAKNHDDINEIYMFRREITDDYKPYYIHLVIKKEDDHALKEKIELEMFSHLSILSDYVVILSDELVYNNKFLMCKLAEKKIYDAQN